MQWIRIALFGNRFEAVSLQQRFVRAGLAAEVHDQPWRERLWFRTRSAAGARLEVLAAQSALADKLLWDWGEAKALSCAAVRCPECRSWHVDYPQFLDHSILTNAALGLIAKLGLLKKEYYCEDCHCTWPKENRAQRVSDPFKAEDEQQKCRPQPLPT